MIVINCDIYRYSADEIHFNLMAVVSDRKLTYEKKLTELQKQLDVSCFGVQLNLIYQPL